MDALVMAADRMIDGFLPIPPDLRRYRHRFAVASKTDLLRQIPIRQGCGNTFRQLPAESKEKGDRSKPSIFPFRRSAAS
ncbi:hypothetical protein [Lysobacter capsici]|uniref:hypothetical protein n=1 Tax=Lysobacter capsici TaxID=435897 RepID=UPI00287B8D86|nr:hypothetical protein [Lysobacter capsici]WND87492.1 hypothetical protein RJ609_08040 [Lysobacter capsici]